MHTWLRKFASGQSTSMGWEEIFASSPRAKLKWPVKKLEWTSHSGKILEMFTYSLDIVPIDLLGCPQIKFDI
jgi:hypothetical protein